MWRMASCAAGILVLACSACAAEPAGDGWGTRRDAAASNVRLRGDLAEFSDEMVADAIRRGVEYLKGAQGPDGSWPGHEGPGDNKFPVGPTAMIAYALIESDLVKYDDPRMKKTLDWLENSDAGRLCNKTYELGLRANAWLAAMKRGGAVYAKPLKKDARILILSTKDGSYTYDSLGDGQSSGDNSNSQYGVLGVWAAAQADLEVPRNYWYLVLKHWLDGMNGDGGWGYHRSYGAETTATMTTAGLASLFVCYDYLLADGTMFVRCAPPSQVAAALGPLTRALNWMDDHFQQTLEGQLMGFGERFYYFYGVERVGLASGYKYFGKTDWYKLGARWILEQQAQDGSWVGGYGRNVSTSFALLFLIRGRHAVLMNKLEYDGDWNNRPRDLAGLTSWVSRVFETTVNWQIVNLKVPPEEWHDAPILYIAGSKAPTFADGDLAALRTYVHEGGTIFSCTECSGAAFNNGMRQVYAKLFPDYPMKEIPPEDEVYTINFKLGKEVKLHMVHNGIRPLAIHVDKDKDLPLAWQLRQGRSEPRSFEIAANVAMYVTDRGLAEKSLVARGARQWPREDDFQPLRAVKVARLKYDSSGGKAGNFDPEPLAWQRFARLMGKQTRTKVEVVGPMAIAELGGSGAQIAVLCGTDQLAVSDEQKQALKGFIAGGGLLVLDAAGGSRAFAESADALVRQITGGKRPETLASGAGLYQQKGFEITQARYRRWSRQKMGVTEKTPRLRAILDGEGKEQILFSGDDLTAGLVGYPCCTLHGYAPESAFELMRNIVLSRARELPRPAAKEADKPKA